MNSNSPQKWQCAPAPLLTRWAKDVSPDNVWPQYPRPQLARERWQSLNGLWDYAVLEAGLGAGLGAGLEAGAARFGPSAAH